MTEEYYTIYEKTFQTHDLHGKVNGKIQTKRIDLVMPVELSLVTTDKPKLLFWKTYKEIRNTLNLVDEIEITKKLARKLKKFVK